MKLKKIIKYSLATSLVFGYTATISGCKKDNTVHNINLMKILFKFLDPMTANFIFNLRLNIF